MTSFLEQRNTMVDRQLKARGIADLRVLEAMRGVPRERFVGDRLHDLAYEDAPLPIEEGQTISQPYVVALMLEAARVKATDRVLEVGAGSGYVAAVLSRLAKDVSAIEWHAALASLAKARLELLGCDNARVMHGDGTLGWPDRAPFDAIVVSAGGPEVPSALLAQLAPGGRLVIPVGSEPKSQDLLVIVRTGDHEYQRTSLGHVHFVPLVGTEGWAADGSAVPSRRMRRPIRLGDREAADLSKSIADSCEPFSSVAKASLERLVERVGAARVVLIGEATHGTSEFYALRARITQALVARAGFNVVAIEADWPDTSMIDRMVRRKDGPPLREPMFSRFPTWMWRNADMQRFTEWLLRYNDSLGTEAAQCAIYGLDVYSLNNSIGAVLDFLERVDPAAAGRARELYSCFSPWERDPAVYGRAAVGGLLPGCEREALAALRGLLEERLEYCRRDGDRFFDAARNATVIAEAEKYYRLMYRGARESWNLRDRHMFETLLAILEHRGPDSKAVVWAHNSHVGNAAATEMGTRGELNVGQLARERFGERCYAIGFGTDRGTVAAASDWDAPMEVMDVRPAHADSYERLCRDSGVEAFFLPLRRPATLAVRSGLLEPRLERAIGVIYRPDTELVSHYFQASLPAQFDEYVWIAETRAVTPVDTEVVESLPDTYPFAL